MKLLLLTVWIKKKAHICSSHNKKKVNSMRHLLEVFSVGGLANDIHMSEAISRFY